MVQRISKAIPGPASRRQRLFMLALLWGALASSPALGDPPRYHFNVWTKENGLPHNSIQAIHQTRDGYLWLATPDGLVRFDGVRFTVFNTANTKGIRSNRFTCFFEDDTGALWIGTGDGSITCYRQGAFVTYTTADGVPEDFISGLQANEAGDLFIATSVGIVRWREGRVAVNVNVSLVTVELLVKVRTSGATVQNPVRITGHDGALSGVAFDGTNIWVGEAGAQFVYKVRASDSTVLDSIRISGNPTALAFDGTNIWSSNDNTGSVNITNGDTRTSPAFGVGSGRESVPQAVAFDGTNMWVSALTDNTVIKMALDGSVVGTYSVGSHPASLVFDGANIWVANTGSNTVTKLRASDGSLVGTFDVNGSPTCLVFDGANVWVGTSASILTKL